MAQRLSRRLVVRAVVEQLIRQPASTHALVRSFAAYLIETKQTKQLDAYLADITTALSMHGQATATVISAHDLDTKVVAALKELVSQQSGAKHVTLEQAIDPSLLGGIQLSFNGRKLDTTVRSQLNQLKATSAAN